MLEGLTARFQRLKARERQQQERQRINEETRMSIPQLAIASLHHSDVRILLQPLHPGFQELAPFADSLAVSYDAEAPLCSRHGN